MACDEKDIEKGAELHPNRESATNERGQTGSLRALIALLAAAGIALGFFIFDAGWFPTTGMTCSPNMYRRSSLIFFDHRPALTAENAFDRSTNVVIELPCLLSLPVYSSMYSGASVGPRALPSTQVRGSFPFSFASVGRPRSSSGDGKTRPILSLHAGVRSF